MNENKIVHADAPHVDHSDIPHTGGPPRPERVEKSDRVMDLRKKRAGI